MVNRDQKVKSGNSPFCPVCYILIQHSYTTVNVDQTCSMFFPQLGLHKTLQFLSLNHGTGTRFTRLNIGTDFYWLIFSEQWDSIPVSRISDIVSKSVGHCSTEGNFADG